MRIIGRFPLAKPAVDAEIETDAESIDFSQGFVAEVEMPRDATLLPFLSPSSNSPLTLYAEIEKDAETELRSFFVCGNGVELPEGVGAATYVGTFKVPGSITAHVFELVKVAA